MLHETIETIIIAKDLDQTVRFLYEDQDGVVTRRMVDPARIHGIKFLGWCCHREDYRRFDMRRMHMVEFGPTANEIHLPLGEPEELGRRE